MKTGFVQWSGPPSPTTRHGASSMSDIAPQKLSVEQLLKRISQNDDGLQHTDKRIAR